MTLTRDDPALARTIESRDQLSGYFREAETPRAEWRVGTEHEKVGIDRESLQPLSYEGERGIRALLERLHSHHGFSPLREEGRLIGLERDGASITLEPGGQLELSGAPFFTLHETCKEFQQHISLMRQVSEPFGIAWLGLGTQPLTRVAEIPRMPRARYTVMRQFLRERGSLAMEMMHATGSVQVSLDFDSETDLARKMRLAMALSPVVTALFANSCFSEGKANGFLSRRSWVWRHTDASRCGLLPFVFEEEWLRGQAYRSYVAWALDVPMIFIEREGAHIDMGGRTFRHYLDQGHPPYRPTLADWHLHLTTLFPEVRVKQVMELRGADAVPAELVCALPALWKGLLYDSGVLQEALDRFGGWTFDQVDALQITVGREGLRADTPSGPALEIARVLLDLAARGLHKLDARNRVGEDERLFLDPLQEIVERGSSPARFLRERWEGPWERRIERLIEYARY